MSRRRQPADRGRMLDAQHITNQIKQARAETRGLVAETRTAMAELVAASEATLEENTSLRTKIEEMERELEERFTKAEFRKGLLSQRSALEDGAYAQAEPDYILDRIKKERANDKDTDDCGSDSDGAHPHMGD